MAWTTAADVIGAWIGDGAPTDSEKVGTWIGKAERLVRREVPDIQERLTAEAAEVPPSTELLDTVRDVVVAMVTRVFRNPEGRRSSQTVTGPFTESVTFGGDEPGGLFLRDDEVAALRGEGAGQSAFTINLTPTTSPFHPDYVAPTDGWA